MSVLERMAAVFVTAIPVPEGINPASKIPWESYEPGDRARILVGWRAALAVLKDLPPEVRAAGKIWPSAPDDYDGDSVLNNMSFVDCQLPAVIDKILEGG